jgi:hypothetical protein
MSKPFWSIPKLWEDGTAIVVGGGPSLRDFDMDNLKGKKCIACNDAGLTINPTFTAFGDKPWFNAYHHKFSKISTQLVTCYKHTNDYPSWVHTCRRLDTGWSFEQTALAWNGNTGAMAINLAARLGAKRIILLGFDMQQDKSGKNNWYQSKRPASIPEVYKRFLSMFHNIQQGCRKESIEVINANLESKLERFPKQAWEDIKW